MKNRYSNYSVCVVIPAYNEGVVIKGVVESVIKLLALTKLKYRVVVVNDGSNDNTASEAAMGGATVINHLLNSGAGSATATGLSYALRNNYSIAATMDADGQHDPTDVLNGITTLIGGDVDLLIGSRLINSDGMSRVKVLGNKGLSLITYLIFSIKTTDSQSGLRIFGPRALKELRWSTNGYEFCSEMLWRANQLNLTVDEYSIKAIYTDYSMSKGQSNWNAINIVKSLLKRRIVEIFE